MWCACALALFVRYFDFDIVFMVKLDLKGSNWPILWPASLLGGSLGGLTLGQPAHLPCLLYPPLGLFAIVHNLLGLATAVQLWGYQWVLLHCCVCAPGLACGVPTHCAGEHG